jgi:uncharacterized protein YrrD
MTIKASSIGNLPIITINDGKNISKVRDIIYDAKTNSVKALLIDEKGWFKGAKILLLKDINSIGNDAVTIEDEDCFINSDDQHDNNISVIVDEDNFLTKNRVLTQSGTDLGRVTDLFFDFPSGEVLTIEVSKGFMQNMGSGAKNINVLDIITMGQDNIMVKDFTEEVFEMQGNEQGVNKLINDTKDTATSIIDAAKQKIDEVVHSKPGQDTVAKTKEVAGNVRDKVFNAYEDTKDSIESGEVEQKLSDTMKEGKVKAQELGRKVHDKISDTYDHTAEEIEASDAKAELDAKIHQTKKELKNAMKESKDHSRIVIK